MVTNSEVLKVFLATLWPVLIALGTAESTSLGNMPVLEGGTITIFLTRRNESSSHFVGYRLQKGEETGTRFMFLPPHSDRGQCIRDAQEYIVQFCQEKCGLTKFNATHLALTMSNLSQSDSGSYRCEIPFGGLHRKSQFETFNLIVRETEPARIAFISSNVSMVLGETLNITCKATGRPVPTVLWRRDNITLSTGSRRIQFIKDGFTTRDVGVYACVAKNNHNITDQKDVYVTLKPSGLTSGSYSKTMNALTVIVTGLVCAYKIM